MESFPRSDGHTLAVVEGLRHRLLSYRPSVTPKPDWAEAEYRTAADRRRKRCKRLAASLEPWRGSLKGARLLDVGCGDGIDCLLLAMEERVELAIGIDLSLPALAMDEKGERARRLIDMVAEGNSGTHTKLLRMDATLMGFADESFDVVVSRSAMEHIQPIHQALAEIVRVTRKGGTIHLGIDPFYWLRGCHKRGVVDIPWAHARLSLDEFEQFVTLTEGAETARKRRSRLETLNRLTISEWHSLVERTGCEVLDWKLNPSELGSQLLHNHPEVMATLLPGISAADLLTERIGVWLRRK